jgi:hypothetical protein
MPALRARESEMSDSELLKLAARACGYEVLYIDDDGGVSCRDGSHSYWWSPLAYDGDALRLAVTLEILVLTARGYAVANGVDSGGTCVRIPFDSDPYAATRRAIVRAAADIGRAMK